MTREQTRVVFMGTPRFAVPSLEALCRAGYSVVLVVSQPDRPRGRGHRLMATPVKEAAEKLAIAVEQPEKVSTPEGVEMLREADPDFLVTCAYGQILSADVLEVPRLGCINVHASLLPKYRGASPIVQAIMHGETETGVTTMYTVREVDAGDILLQKKTDIGSDETGEELAQRLAQIGAEAIVETLDGLIGGTVKRTAQNHDDASYYPMFPKKFGQINWNTPASQIVDFVRALSPAPGAYFLLNGEKVQVLKASTAAQTGGAAPGTIVCADPRTGLEIAASDRLVRIETLKRAGSRTMPAADSLRGRPMEAGAILPSAL